MSETDDSFAPPEDRNPKKEKKRNKRKENEENDEKVSLKKKQKMEGKEDTNSDEASFIVGKDGVKMYSLGNERYVSRSGFKGKEYINIREYYKADGELKPGKKGISLTIEQFENLKKVMACLL
uniref:PC4 domain-containing protein n=1 Tax=Strongyloides stercoralis TaxID=6248 RepID=A0A0K0EEH6_STRER